MTAVITPTGRPVPMHFAAQSEHRRSMAPNAADAGIRYLLSDPRNILATWGATSPMNPIVPVNDTRVAVTRDTTISDRSLMRLAFTPRLTASLSHIARMLSFLDRSIMATTPTMAADTWNQMLSQLRLAPLVLFSVLLVTSRLLKSWLNWVTISIVRLSL